MFYYNCIYASSYRFYSRFKGETPWGTSIILVSICQIELFFLILAFIKKITQYNLFLIFPNKFYFLPIFFIWLFINFKYYTKKRVEKIVDKFEQKNIIQKRIYGVLTIVSFLLPLFLIFFLLKKS